MARKFNPAEVVFTVTAQQDDMVAPDFDLGDETLNRELREGIEARLERGDVWAWASVKVSASFGGFTGNAYLGGCNYTDEADFRANSGYFKDMVLESVNALVGEITEAGWALDCTLEDIRAAVSKEALTSTAS